MKISMHLHDGRLIARIINLVHQFGCSYTRLYSRKRSESYSATIELEGPPDALRRLGQKLTALITHEEELLW